MQLGPFQLVSLLGRGTVGEVWRAVHAQSGDQVALKRLAPERSAAWRQLVRREVEAVARLDHPAVVWIHDHGEDDAHGPWIAYELASGGTLADRLPLSDWGALRSMLQEALRHAHARGVLHRDLKPGNVLLCTLDDARPGPKLADFSLARVGAARGTAGGTPGYSAPEQRDGRWRDEGPWTDLYALGALAWTATCGSPPDAGSWRPRFQVPGAFAAWVERLLAAEPERRYPSAAAATEALRAAPAAAGSAPARERFTFDLPPDAEAPRPHPRRSAASLGLFGLRPIPVVDRHAEQSRVRAALRAAESDGGPVVVRWLGEAGVGKSRLLEWVAVTAREADRAVVIEAALGSRDLAEALRGPWAAALARRHAAAPARVAAYLEGGDDDVVELFAEWTRGYGGPVVLLLDEVPAAGRAERQLGELSRRCAPAVVVVAAGRDGGPTDGVEDVRLGRLRESGALARALGVADAALAHELGRRGDGVPSLIVASVREAVRSGALAPGPDGWVATRPLDPGLPEEVAAALQRRLPVGGADRAALELLALGGPGATAEAWSTLCARAGVAWSPGLADQLRRAGLVTADPHPRVADGSSANGCSRGSRPAVTWRRARPWWPRCSARPTTPRRSGTSGACGSGPADTCVGRGCCSRRASTTRGRARPSGGSRSSTRSRRRWPTNRTRSWPPRWRCGARRAGRWTARWSGPSRWSKATPRSGASRRGGTR